MNYFHFCMTWTRKKKYISKLLIFASHIKKNKQNLYLHFFSPDTKRAYLRELHETASSGKWCLLRHQNSFASMEPKPKWSCRQLHSVPGTHKIRENWGQQALTDSAVFISARLFLSLQESSIGCLLTSLVSAAEASTKRAAAATALSLHW